MKSRIPWVALLVFFSGLGGSLLIAPAGHAADPLSLDDVLRLHAGGLSDDIIASEILVTDTIFELSAEDLLRLKEAGISEVLIQFMVETGLDDQADAEGKPAGEGRLESDSPDDTYASGGWTNVIEEEPASTYFVTLDYDYPAWWYDFYWSDYWYYDYHYYPYACSYSFVWDAWYPTWFSYRYCYLPPYWGYRSQWWGYHGYHWTYADCGSYYPHGGTYTPDAYRTNSLSRTKYKYSTGGSSGKILYADMGLKVRDVDRLTRTASRVDDRTLVRPVKDRILVADGRNPGRPGGDRVRRPIKSVGLPDRLASGLGKPLEGKRSSVSAVPHVRRTVTRPTTRRPALDKPSTPVRTIDRTRTTGRTDRGTIGKPSSLDKPHSGSRTDPVVVPPPRVSKPRSSTVAPSKPAPKPTPVKTKPAKPEPEVEPAPTPSRNTPPRAAPAPPAPKRPPHVSPPKTAPPKAAAPSKERPARPKSRTRAR